MKWKWKRNLQAAQSEREVHRSNGRERWSHRVQDISKQLNKSATEKYVFSQVSSLYLARSNRLQWLTQLCIPHREEVIPVR